MATPAVKLIGLGVDKIERAKAQNKIPRLANLAKAPTTPPEIQNFAVTGKARRDRLRAIQKEDNSFMERRTVEINAAVTGLGLSANETRIAIDKGIVNARRERAEATQPERVKIAAEDRDDAAMLNSIKAPWHSAVAILNTSSLKSRDRADYAANMKDCTPLELDNYFTTAVAGGDRDLAAACCGRYNNMNKAQKSQIKTVPSEVAEVLVTEFFIVQEAFALADLYHEESKLVALQIEGKRTSPDQKIKIGTMLAALASDFGITDPDNLDAPKNETFEQALDRKFPGKPGHNPDAAEDAKRMAAGLPPL